jgi:hypothetical protein
VGHKVGWSGCARWGHLVKTRVILLAGDMLQCHPSTACKTNMSTGRTMSKNLHSREHIWLVVGVYMRADINCSSLLSAIRTCECICG